MLKKKGGGGMVDREGGIFCASELVPAGFLSFSQTVLAFFAFPSDVQYKHV